MSSVLSASKGGPTQTYKVSFFGVLVPHYRKDIVFTSLLQTSNIVLVTINNDRNHKIVVTEKIFLV
jgi:hypothetical protein